MKKLYDRIKNKCNHMIFNLAFFLLKNSGHFPT